MSIIIYSDEGTDTKLIESAFDATLGFLGQKDPVFVEVTMTDEESIRETNRESRGIDSVTDVLSFPSIGEKPPVLRDKHPTDVDPESGEIMLGEILICTKRAEEQASEYGHSRSREIAYLTVHGLLHLFGYDHMNDVDKAEMRAAEEKILSTIGESRE